MADEGKLCVCPQCGKKYRLKAGFEAKSFSCKACGATVWVEGKPPAPAPTARKRPTVRAGKGRRGARAAAPRPAKRGRGRHEAAEEAAAEGEEGRRGRYQSKPKSSANIIMAVAALALVGGIVVLFVMSGKDEPPETTPVSQQPPAGPGTPAIPPMDVTQPGTPAMPPGTPTNVTPGTPEQPAEPDEPEEPTGEEPTTPPRELGGQPTSRAPGTSRWDPPATLGHLETTPPELRKKIDEQVAILLDPQAGREVHEAKAMLAAIGKPAFPVVLGAMARVRDTLTDNDTMEERLIESSLMLADQCLREMDGNLDGHGKQPIRPGTDKKYVQYILRLHYKRWVNDLQDMPEMPGAYDPTKEYTGEVEEEE